MPPGEPQRIALFTYATQPRGGVLHALALAEALLRAGNAVTLFAVDCAGARFVREPACPCVLVELDAREESLDDFVRRRSDAFVAALDARGDVYDVYHAHDGIGADALRRLAERGAIDSYVRTVHHLTSYGDPRVDDVERRSITGAHRVFVVSRVWQTELYARYGILAQIVGNGVDRARFFPRARASARDPAAPRFVTIGGIEERKNTIALFDAFALVKQTHARAHLTIVGGASVLDHTSYRRACDARAIALGLRAQIDYDVVGRVADAELVARLHGADAFVFPSLVEGFGLVVLEALACAVPVVVSEIAPFVDYLAASDAVFVSPRDPRAIADGMLAALEPAVRARLCERGPHVAARFTWDAVAAACLRGYDA